MAVYDQKHLYHFLVRYQRVFSRHQSGRLYGECFIMSICRMVLGSTASGPGEAWLALWLIWLDIPLNRTRRYQ